MNSKVFLFLAAVTVANATTLLGTGLLNSGILAPRLLKSGIVASGLALKAASPSILSTSSVLATPGAITSDKRIIRTNGVIAGAPIAFGTGLFASPYALSNGIISNSLIGAAPLALRTGIVSPIGLKGSSILSGPVFTTLFK